MVGPLPPKYQNSPKKVAPHPREMPTSSPSSKFKCSFTFPERLMVFFIFTCYNLTIKVNNHRFITLIISIQNQDSLNSGSRTCSCLSCCRSWGRGSGSGRSRWWCCRCCGIRRGWCLPTCKIITWASPGTISLKLLTYDLIFNFWLLTHK